MMAMLSGMFTPAGDYPAPGTGTDYLPFEPEAAQAAREAAARHWQRRAFMEGQPDQKLLDALNAGASEMMPPAVMSAPATAPADAAATSPPRMQTAGPDSAPAESPNATPSWLGMLNGAPFTYPKPSSPSPAAGAYAQAVPADVPPTRSASGDVPPTSLLGRLGEGALDFLKGANEWRKNNRSTLMALGAGMAGSQSLGQGLQRGMQLALPAQQADLAQQKQNQTAKWLVEKKGMSPQEAEALVNNPEILKQVLPQLMGAKQLEHVNIKGIGGEDIPLVWDPARGVYLNPDHTPYTGRGGSGGGEMPTGQEYLDKYVPKEMHAAIKAAANYDVPTSGFGSMKQLTPHVLNFDPNFDAANYQAKVALKKSFMGGGNDFKGLEAFNTVGTHMGELMEAAKELNPSDWKIANNIRNLYSDYVTDNPKLVRFRNALNTTQHELGNAYHAGHITDSSLHSFQQAIADNMSTPGLKAAIGEMAGLLSGKINAKEENYNTSFPGKQLPPGFQALNTKTKDAFKRINDWSKDIATGPEARALAGTGAAPTGAPAAVPREVQSLPVSEQMRVAPNGSIVRWGNQRLVKDGGKWQPLQ
jgi:hypothetical protein